MGSQATSKNKGINANIGKLRARVIVGGKNAPYGPITEYTSRKKGWITTTRVYKGLKQCTEQKAYHYYTREMLLTDTS